MPFPVFNITTKGGITPIDPRPLTNLRFDEGSSRVLGANGDINRIQFRTGVWTTQSCQAAWTFCSNTPNANDPLGNQALGNTYSNYTHILSSQNTYVSPSSFFALHRRGGTWFTGSSGGVFTSSGAGQIRTMWGYGQSETSAIGFATAFDDFFTPATLSTAWRPLIQTYNSSTRLAQMVYNGVYYSTTLSRSMVLDVSFPQGGQTSVYHCIGATAEAGIVSGVEWTKKEMLGVELHMNQYWGL